MYPMITLYKVATTLDTYGHLSIEGKKEAAHIIGGLLTDVAV